MDLIVHKETNITWLLHRKKWLTQISLRTCPLCAQASKGDVNHIISFLPSAQSVRSQLGRLARSSCAVVGASSALKNCTASREICEHDIVFHVNDHPESRQHCKRVDVQVANAYACVRKEEKLVTLGDRQKPCKTHPKIFRLRHEWNMKKLATYATDAWLGTGITSTLAHREVGTHAVTKQKCCATAGGVAAGFALLACRKVTLFGMGGVGKRYVDDVHKYISSVHNTRGELAWMLHLNATGAAGVRCF